jgi:hypothetical protein
MARSFYPSLSSSPLFSFECTNQKSADCHAVSFFIFVSGIVGQFFWIGVYFSHKAY